jgi:hypothetical protein
MATEARVVAREEGSRTDDIVNWGHQHDSMHEGGGGPATTRSGPGRARYCHHRPARLP